MAIDLADLVDPSGTAILTMEVQKGTIGAQSPFDELVQAARTTDLVSNIGRLALSGRSKGIRVVHCTARFRNDLAGSGTNSPLLSAMTRHKIHILEDTEGAEIISEIYEPDIDLECARYHGVSPFSGTALDSMLSNMGVQTVVATGVSLNLAILGLCIEAVNLGYRVALPIDAVAGFPKQYADSLISNTLSLLATRTTVDELIGVWEQ
ncbi:MAG TPA: cysteine hydrolase family protein [Acidimicrobiales bacterium]|nr:cysteine hydrolase family protein [Acidimicrobiales bacterium]